MLKIVRILLLMTGVFQCSQAADLVCFPGCNRTTQSAPLEDPVSLITNKCVDLTKKTLIFAHGFQGHLGGPAITGFVDTYEDDSEFNCLVLDWHEEASAGLLEPVPAAGYITHALPNAYKVGDKYGQALTALAKAGLDMKKTYLIGHSLGAHVSCFAGRVVKSAGYEVARVIGCDPAGNIFDTPLVAGTEMDETCGNFVMAIHTDPLGMGTARQSGHVNVWVNHGPVKKVQPGCPVGFYPMFSDKNLCSHNLSWRIILQSETFENSFMAAPAPTYEAWEETNGTGTPIIVVGMETNIEARGNHYLRTNPNCPYGMFEEGSKPNDP